MKTIPAYKKWLSFMLADGTTEIARTATNGFDQVITEAVASTSDLIYTYHNYNARGQRVKSWQAVENPTQRTASTLYEYDNMGQMIKQTLALANSPTVSNSPIVVTAYGAEVLEDGTYSTSTRTRYNAAGTALVSTQKQLISELSSTMESKSISIDERGLASTEWTEYNAGTKRTRYSTIPTSNLTATAVSVDGFAVTQTDHAGITTSQTRAYTSTGMTLSQTDGRGNATTSLTDKVGRTLSMTDAAGNTTTTTYCADSDNPATVTNAQGKETHYRYDVRGRKVAEWGTAIQPACFSYDDSDHLVRLTTYRVDGETISSDPSERTDGDNTLWTYDEVTGLELTKTYADGSTVTKTYDAFNRLATETDARGIVKTHSYETARGLLLSTSYSDGTTTRSYTYNHLSQLSRVVDDAGTRNLGYNAWAEPETDSLAAGDETHLLTELRDELGRSSGYTYMLNNVEQQSVNYGYGADGRLSTAGFEDNGENKSFTYGYLSGTNLLHTLAMPNGITLTQQYEEKRNLLTSMAYTRGETSVAERTYSYDTLGRPTSRTETREGNTTRSDAFTHNDRSELTAATLGNAAYAYAYDNIGNRKTAQENAEEATNYDANELNQYTAVGEFVPEFDADGNQTKVQTSTGIWTVVYNAENRPVTFTRANEDGTSTKVSCSYDYMGRRATKKVETIAADSTSTTLLHHRYIYRGYLQIVCCDLLESSTPSLWLITWDPTQPVATRPLAIQMNSTWYTYGWDLTKNICEVFGTDGFIKTAYNYTPYGAVTREGTVAQPIQWSSEFYDGELGLIYYIYRHYTPKEGRWIGRDPYKTKQAKGMYRYVNNRISFLTDVLGLKCKEINSRQSIWYEGGIVTLTPKLISNSYIGEISECPKCGCAFVWIHGYNTDERKARSRGETVEKAYKGAKGKCDVYNFIWKGDPGPHHFFAAAEAARLVGAGPFANFIRNFQAKCPKTQLHVGTHSLGAAVVLSALEHGTSVGKVFLTNAAVDNEALAEGEEFSHAASNATAIYVMHSEEDDTLESYYNWSSFNVALGENGLDEGGKYANNIHEIDFTNDFGDKHDAVYQSELNSDFWAEIALRTTPIK